MLIDTHAHLDYPDFKQDLDSVLDQARDQGVSRVVAIGTNLDSSRAALRLAEEYSEVYAAVGIHPSEAQDAPDDVISPLRELAAHPKVAALGETGLDFHRLPSSRRIHAPDEATRALGSSSTEDKLSNIEDGHYISNQEIVFQQQLDLAVELGRNVVVHQRDAWKETLDFIKPYQGKLRAVFHCFVGTAAEAMELIGQGHLVSFTGIVTFKNATDLRETVREVPLESMMLETDAPFLAPEPHRGQRAAPGHVRLIAETIAKVKGVSLEEVAQTTTRTAEEFFNFK